MSQYGGHKIGLAHGAVEVGGDQVARRVGPSSSCSRSTGIVLRGGRSSYLTDEHTTTALVQWPVTDEVGQARMGRHDVAAAPRGDGIDVQRRVPDAHIGEVSGEHTAVGGGAILPETQLQRGVHIANGGHARAAQEQAILEDAHLAVAIAGNGQVVP